MDCTHCGSTLGKDTLKFCPYCGEQVAQGDVQSAPPENPVSDAEEDKSFSETAWFMAAVDSDQLEEREGEALNF